MFTAIVASAPVMLALGLLTHFLVDVIALRKADQSAGFREYWTANPYQSALSIVGAMAGYAVLHSAGELTLVTAYGVGYMANSVPDIIGKRTGGKL